MISNDEHKMYSSIIEKMIKDNSKYLWFVDYTIEYSFDMKEDVQIMGSCSKKTNIVSMNIKSIEHAIETNTLMDVEYFLLHEIRHSLQHREIDRLNNNEECVVDRSIVEKWKEEQSRYIPSKNEDGRLNKEYFYQDSEMDAYGFSYAVMKYKYGDVTGLYTPEYNQELFYEIVNDWLEAFKQNNISKE